MNYVELSKRFWALLIDVIFLIVVVVFFTVVVMEGIYSTFIVRILFTSYFVVLPPIFGGTFGKRLFHFKIVSSDGKNINLISSVVRFLPFVFVILLREFLINDSNIMLIEFIASWIPTAFYLVEAIVVSRSDCRQSLHDQIARTYVVYDN